ncbi:MAG: NTPase [bacterium]
MHYRKNILLTGLPGIGKTTLIHKVLNLVAQTKGIETRKRSITGFYTEEIREGGWRKGFKIKTLSGDEAVLSHVEIKSPYRVGRYGIDLGEFERVAIPSMSGSQPEVSIIVIDEIGKMECFSQNFKQKVIEALDSNKRVMATIALKGAGFIDVVKNRKDVTLVQVTEANRNELARILADELTSQPGPTNSG